VPENPYNQVLYATFPQSQTHPDRAAAVGVLCGMEPAPVTACRVLEIGCGNGNNLIPMAYSLSGSHFLGVDLAEEPIQTGRAAVNTLGLKNIELAGADLRDIGPEYGVFDYIIAHGVYSWVPAAIRDRLLAVCSERLSPRGIAFVSYNAYPGGHVRQMFREMMLYHTRNVTDGKERTAQARWFLEFLLGVRGVSQTWKDFLDSEIKAVLEHNDAGIFHDDLAETNQAFYFRDFAAHAGSHGLQYLGEAAPHEMFDPPGVLKWLEGSVIEREQYLDFLRMRRFRQTLLCHEGIPIRRIPSPEDMDRFLFSAPARKLEGGQIEGRRGVRISSVHEAVDRVTSALGETYPLPLSFDDLVPYAGDAAALREILFGLLTGGFADPHVYEFPCEESVTARPKASALVRFQAASSPFVTNACHNVVELDDIGRRLVQLLDGSRDHATIAQALAEVPEAPPPDEIRKNLISGLEWMAKMALLEA
jgi:methyltransferase-like protein